MCVAVLVPPLAKPTRLVEGRRIGRPTRLRLRSLRECPPAPNSKVNIAAMLLAWKTRTVGVVAKLTVLAFVPSGSGRELQEERPVPTRVVMLAERGTERAGWESSVADDIEGERGSQERSGPASSKAAFSARIRRPMVTTEAGRSDRKET